VTSDYFNKKHTHNILAATIYKLLHVSVGDLTLF